MAHASEPGRILLVTGSAPPDACGVGDYTVALAEALERAGQPVELFCQREWGLDGTLRALAKLRGSRQLIHIQYPTVGYGWSLGPQLCALAIPSIVTIHEFSQAHPLRKLSLLPFTWRAPRIVMTSEFESRALAARMPWTAGRSRVIPIGSNIVPLPGERRSAGDSVAYFGLIMPRKGLEEFLELARLAKDAGLDWKLTVIGRVKKGKESYARELMERSRALGVQWLLERSAEEVSGVLGGTTIAYLPFPDGASERRGSLQAVLGAGCACITTRAQHSPAGLEPAVCYAASPAEALACSRGLMAEPAERARLARAGREYAAAFSWEAIAQSHVQLYRELLSAGGR